MGFSKNSKNTLRFLSVLCVYLLLNPVIRDALMTILIGLALLMVPLIFLIWVKQEYSILLIMILSFSVDWLAMDLEIIPYSLTWLPDMILFILLLKVLNKFLTYKKVEVTNFTGLLIVLGLFSGISAIMNGVDLFKIIAAYRVFFRYIILVYVIINIDLSKEFLERCIKILLLLFLIQVPITIYQYTVLDMRTDSVSGTVRSTGSLLVLMVFGISIIISFFLEYGRKSLIFLATPLFIPPTVGEGKYFFVLFPVIALITLSKYLFRNVKISILVLLLFLGVFILAMNFFEYIEDEVGKKALDTITFLSENNENYSVGVSSAARFLEINHAFDETVKTVPLFIGGRGMGSLYMFKDEYEINVLDRNTTTLSYKLQELGAIGFLLYMFIYFRIIQFRVRHKPIQEDKFWNAILNAVIPITVAFVLSMPYTDIDVKSLSFTYWFLIACMYKVNLFQVRPRNNFPQLQLSNA